MTIDTVKIFKNEQNKHALVSKKLEKRPVKTGEDRPVWKVRPDRTGPAGPVPVYRSGSKSGGGSAEVMKSSGNKL